MKETLTGRMKIAEGASVVNRIAIVIIGFLMFFPTLNPARLLSGNYGMNKNLSLFTSAVSYESIMKDGMTKINKGNLPQGPYIMLGIICTIFLIAIIATAAGGCLSLGNRKCRKLGSIFSLAGGVGMTVAMGGILMVYNTFAGIDYVTSSKPASLALNFPNGYYVFAVLVVLALLSSIVMFFMLLKEQAEEKFEMEVKFKLFLLFLPFIALILVFSYLPLWGWRYAFYEYYPGDNLTMDKWKGFYWFTYLFKNAATRRDIVMVLRNTLAMSGLGIATSWVAMAFAIFLSEIKTGWYRRFIQIFTTIPNFISWVLVYALALAIFSTDGFMNNLFQALHWDALVMPKGFLMNDQHSWLKMLAWGMWKGVGWSAIIYIAGISGIDQQLYEAATVDGAGRFQKMWHITLPGLIPTYCVLLLMSIAGVLSNGMDQYLVFSNPVNEDSLKVLDLYVYNLGIGSGGDGTIPLSTVIGMAKSIISVVLLFLANGISKLIRGESII